MTERGWYPDPDGAGERWHDGTRWTGVTRHTEQSAAYLVELEKDADRRDRRSTRRHRAGFVTLLLVTVVVAVGVTVLIHPDQLAPISRALGIGPHRRLPEVTPAVRSRSYAIANTDAAGDPVTYDPCEAVHYVVNPAGAPANYLDFIQPAVEQTQAATGLEFIYDGVSSETWSDHRRATKPEPVLIVFMSVLDSPKADDDVIGLGGSTFVEGSLERPHYITGQIALLRSWFLEESARRETDSERAVVMHELGHVVGLAHVKDPRQLMYSKNNGQTEYGDGDLTGLAELGAGHCS